jgi:hypothetical protein
MALAMATTAVPGAAQSETATAQPAKLFDEAREAFGNKDYALAARKFEAAYRLAPRGQTAYNAALSWEAANEPTRAADDFAVALDDAALPPAPQSHAQARLAAIARTSMRLRLESAEPASVSVDEIESRPLPATVHLRPGSHKLVVKFADGRTVRQEIEARPGERVSLKIASPAVEAARAEVDRRPAPAVAPRAPEPAPMAPQPLPMAPARGGAQRTAGWIFLGTSAAATGIAIFLGVRGLDARDTYEASGNTDEGARSDAVSLRGWANVAWVSAIVLGATGVVLLVTAPRKASSAGPTVAAGIGGIAGMF